MTNPIADDVFFLLVVKILKNVSCEYNRWVVETQLCKLRDSSDTLIWRAWAMFHFLKVNETILSSFGQPTNEPTN